MDTEQMLVHKFSYFDSITVMYFFAACICSLMAHMARLGFRFMCICFDFLFTYTYTFATWHGFH